MSAEFLDLLRALILVGIANGAPVIGKLLLGQRLDYALDAGRRFADGRPWFGPSKTVRGVVLAVAVAALAGAMLGVTWWQGAFIGLYAMIGDLLSSFTKRRLGIRPSGKALGLDQIPESLLPLLACRAALGLGYGDVAVLVVAFFVLELVLSRLLYRLNVREQPY